jgi:hypothetical protein
MNWLRSEDLKEEKNVTAPEIHYSRLIELWPCPNACASWLRSLPQNAELQQSAGLYCQRVQRHFQLCDGRADLGMFSYLLLQRFEDLLSTCDVCSRLSWIWLRILFALRFHVHLLPSDLQLSTMTSPILRTRRLSVGMIR